ALRGVTGQQFVVGRVSRAGRLGVEVADHRCRRKGFHESGPRHCLEVYPPIMPSCRKRGLMIFGREQISDTRPLHQNRRRGGIVLVRRPGCADDGPAERTRQFSRGLVMSLRLLLLVGWCWLATAVPPAAFAEPLNPDLYAALRWRMIGPFRGGRTVAAVGVRGQPNLFYVGVTNGGVWKTTDAGRTWNPIFDDQPTRSLGALALAPSNPNVLYAGSGEGLQRPDLSTGDGVYKSTDGGKTWKNVGLRDGQQISAILVDPKDPDRVFVAVLGHPYGPNPERGVYRTTD